MGDGDSARPQVYPTILDAAGVSGRRGTIGASVCGLISLLLFFGAAIMTVIQFVMLFHTSPDAARRLEQYKAERAAHARRQQASAKAHWEGWEKVTMGPEYLRLARRVAEETQALGQNLTFRCRECGCSCRHTQDELYGQLPSNCQLYVHT
jgi:hypothetical protein